MWFFKVNTNYSYLCHCITDIVLKKEIITRIKTALSGTSAKVTVIQEDVNNQTVMDLDNTSERNKDQEMIVPEFQRDKPVNSDEKGPFNIGEKSQKGNVEKSPEADVATTSTTSAGTLVRKTNKTSTVLDKVITDRVTQALDNFLDELHKHEASDDVCAECRFWDFAGQKDYYATHQVFLSPHVLYILVSDLSKDIKPVSTGITSYNTIAGKVLTYKEI